MCIFSVVNTTDVHNVSITDVHYLVSTTDVHYLVNTTDVHILVSTTDVHIQGCKHYGCV